MYWEGAEGYIPVKKTVEPKNDDEVADFEKKIREIEAVTRHHRPTMMFTQDIMKNPNLKNEENIKVIEEFIKQKSSEYKFEKKELKSPDREQKLSSPAKYSKI